MPVMVIAVALLWFRFWVNINWQDLSAGGVQIVTHMVLIPGFQTLRPGSGQRLALPEVLHPLLQMETHWSARERNQASIQFNLFPVQQYMNGNFFLHLPALFQGMVQTLQCYGI